MSPNQIIVIAGACLLALLFLAIVLTRSGKTKITSESQQESQNATSSPNNGLSVNVDENRTEFAGQHENQQPIRSTQ